MKASELPTEEVVTGVVLSALEAVRDAAGPAGPDTVLFGRGGLLDSLGLVTLVVAVEQRLEEAVGVSLTLADERALSQRRSPFRTVASLAAYVSERLREPPDA